MEGKKILLFNYTDVRNQNKISAICSSMQIRMKKIKKAQYLSPIGALAGLEGFEEAKLFYDDAELKGPMMILCGFSRRDMDLFLDQMDKKGVPKITHKAMLTPANSHWNALFLYEHLNVEHKAMNGQKEQ